MASILDKKVVLFSLMDIPIENFVTTYGMKDMLVEHKVRQINVFREGDNIGMHVDDNNMKGAHYAILIIDFNINDENDLENIAFTASSIMSENAKIQVFVLNCKIMPTGTIKISKNDVKILISKMTDLELRWNNITIRSKKFPYFLLRTTTVNIPNNEYCERYAYLSRSGKEKELIELQRQVGNNV